MSYWACVMWPAESIAASTSLRRALAAALFDSGLYVIGFCGSPASSAACFIVSFEQGRSK